MSTLHALADALNAALPQTQCTRCGYPDCRSYANAIAFEAAPINQCPPGGDDGVARLAQIARRAVEPLNPANGKEGPLQLAVIDEAWCIGCTLCIDACPVDSIVGAPKLMHTVVAAQCTGCELCIPVCPVDCIALRPVSGTNTGWAAWSEEQATTASERYAFHRLRTARDAQAQSERLSRSAPSATDLQDKRSAVAQAMARARAARSG